MKKRSNPLITPVGIRNLAILAALGLGGWYAWKKWLGPKLMSRGDQSQDGGGDVGTPSSLKTGVKTLIQTESAQKYAGTMASPIVIPGGPYAVQAGKSYATPSMIMTPKRKTGYTYTPIIKSQSASGVGFVRQFVAPVTGMFTGMLLKEGTGFWAEIKTA